MSRFIKVVCLLACAGLLSACAPNINADSYNVASVGQVNRVQKGIITNIKPVTVGANSGVGGATGAVIGGVAGSAIGGGGRANIIGAVGGAVAGGLLGNAIDSSANTQQGMQYIIRLLPGGRTISVVQGTQPKLYRGQRVLVIYGPRTRVEADTHF